MLSGTYFLTAGTTLHFKQKLKNYVACSKIFVYTFTFGCPCYFNHMQELTYKPAKNILHNFYNFEICNNDVDNIIYLKYVLK